MRLLLRALLWLPANIQGSFQVSGLDLVRAQAWGSNKVNSCLLETWGMEAGYTRAVCSVSWTGGSGQHLLLGSLVSFLLPRGDAAAVQEGASLLFGFFRSALTRFSTADQPLCHKTDSKGVSNHLLRCSAWQVSPVTATYFSHNYFLSKFDILTAPYLISGFKK